MGPDAERGDRIAAVVGLGNPGITYGKTRHNVGFQVVDRLVQKFHIGLQERKFRASWGTGSVEGRRLLFLKPLTFMNRSGEAVGEALRYFTIPITQVLVIHDDLDLPCGKIRLVRGGGAGGHRGVASIIEHLGRQNFPRLKLGIGRPVHGEPVESYVLDAPYADQVQLFEDMVLQGAEIVEALFSSDLETVMNRFNR